MSDSSFPEFPAPPASGRLLLDCGSGGRAAQRLIQDLFLKYLGNPILNCLDDAARLELRGPTAMSTDGYTVDPPVFPGGDIGSLAVHGTINDVAMLGALPRYMSCSFILEEGLDMALLERVVASMGRALAEADVLMVTGDTKVVPKGAADKLFIVSTGVGEIQTSRPPSGSRAQDGDAILLSGPVGDHGLTIMAARAGLPLPDSVRSDSASLHRMTLDLVRHMDVHVLRDPTRGGLATTLNEIAGQSGVVCQIEEASVPVREDVRQGCAVLGLDPLYLANEGKCICIVPEQDAEQALARMRGHAVGKNAVRIGSVRAPGATEKAGQVVLRTALGGRRLLPMLEAEPLPRIC